MPIRTDHGDHTDSALERAAQQDPWVMYLVVRQDVAASIPDVLLAAAQATIACVDELGAHPAWAESFQAWAQRSFRKVSLRARGSAWIKAARYDAGIGRAADTEIVRALPPRIRSQRDPFLRGLQVYAPQPEELGAARIGEDVDGPAMTFVLNPSASMSVGKQVAQIAHAVVMCAWSELADEPRYREAFVAWRAAGYPGRIAPASAWEHVRAHGDGVVVRDAGLTEVDPGTETVIALPPGHEAIGHPI